jgi:DNA mismatch endonuclease (patch repair protein)
MPDVVNARTRSRMMSGIKGKNTRPELLLRQALHARGFRFRLHPRGLPGRPDLVFAKHKAVVMVNGCFWHMHECQLFKWPETRAAFWTQKLTHNCLRDAAVRSELIEGGWRVATVWECALRGSQHKLTRAVDRVENWLRSKQRSLDLI